MFGTFPPAGSSFELELSTNQHFIVRNTRIRSTRRLRKTPFPAMALVLLARFISDFSYFPARNS